MVEIKKSNREMIDFSLVPSLECNLECPFCMYDSGPNNKKELNFRKTKHFLMTVDWRQINSCGFYGGEPSINLPLYQKFIDLIPSLIPKFIITNGTWTTDTQACLDFYEFLDRNDLHVVVSGTPYHKEHQNRMVLEEVKKACPTGITLKGDDRIQPMGRAARTSWDCTGKCLNYKIPTRMALFPGGDILFQNCDGVYPLVQTYETPFTNMLDKVATIINKC